MLPRRLAFAALCALVSTAHAADYDIDQDFGSNGWQRLYQPGGGSQDEKGVAFARTADGGYVVVAELPGGGANGGTGKRIGLFRLDRDGNLVTSGFGSGGRVFKDAWLTSVTAMTLDAQGRIIVVGATPEENGWTDFGVVRFNADGSDDTSFAGDGGTAFGAYDGFNTIDLPTSVLAEADGRIVVAGTVVLPDSSTRFGVFRLNVDGSLDHTFGSIDDGHGGRRGSVDVFVASHNAIASRILHAPDSHFVIVGSTQVSPANHDFAVRILSPGGVLWTDSAGGSAAFSIDDPAPGASADDLVADAAWSTPGKLVIAGTANSKFAAIRVAVDVHAPGTGNYLTWDSSFVGSQLPTRPGRYIGEYSTATAMAVAVRSDGSVLIAGGKLSGAVENVGMLTRLRADGSADDGFASAGTSTYIAPTSSSEPSDYTTFTGVLLDGTAPVLLGNAVDSTNAVTDFDVMLTRLQSDRIFADGFE